MTFRPTFDCLWCGKAWTTRAPGDLEGWAHLCPDCLGKAGSNRFLRDRLRKAIAERGRASGPVLAPPAETVPAPPADPVPAPPAARSATVSPVRRSVQVPRALPDDWFFRRGAFSQGAIHDTAWTAELDVVTRWLDAQPLQGTIVEPAAGVGFFSPLLAGRGELRAYEADEAAADLVRERLVAHRLRAHLHVRDPWTAPSDEPAADALVATFVLGRVRQAGVETVLRAWRDRMRRGGRLAIVDLLPDPSGGPPPDVPWSYHEDDLLTRALRRAGFTALELGGTGRFFRQVAADAD